MTQLHRCDCGGISEWHYILKRDASGRVTPCTDLSDGTMSWSPGQASIGNEKHPVSYSELAVLNSA